MSSSYYSLFVLRHLHVRSGSITSLSAKYSSTCTSDGSHNRAACADLSGRLQDRMTAGRA
jgi:hypothetical protein